MIPIANSPDQGSDDGVIEVGPCSEKSFQEIAVHFSDMPYEKYGWVLWARKDQTRWYNYQPPSRDHAAFYVYYQGWTPVLRATRWWWFTRFLLWCSPARKLWVWMVGV